MAYNLESLTRILEQILHHDHRRWILDHHQKTAIESLLGKASSLKQKILENSWPLISDQRIKTLVAKIRDAAHTAEDIIEPHIVDHVLLEPRGKSFTFSPQHLQQVIQELDSAKNDLKEISDQRQKPDIWSPAAVSHKPGPPSSRNIPVGLDDDVRKLQDRFTGEPRKLDIIPIIGSGGVGKTTLARCLYNDRLIVEHFDIRAWITVSQDYNVPAIQLGLFHGITGKGAEYLPKNKYLWETSVHQNLFGRRYLIVLDDVWSSKAWEGIMHCFPDNNNGSRIMLTTREPDVGLHLSRPGAKPHWMQGLELSDSWELLQQKVFGKDQECPPALESIGKEIARRCSGIPLAVDVIGGLLSKAEKTAESWELIERDVTAVLSEDEDFFEILSLSYDHLPDHLKPCFLYMGAFPENYEVLASKLVRLWIAEGFVKATNGDQSLEQAAMSYLEALVSRNLLMVQEKDCHGKAKSYSIHDCLRDLCVRKAKQEKFLYVRNQKARQMLEEGPLLAKWRRVSADPSFCLQDIFHDQKESELLVRSFMFISLQPSELLSTALFQFRLLRVLDVFDIEFRQFPGEILQLVNLRYLALCCNTDRIPPEMSRLWNLQILIARSSEGYIDMPAEIWEMPELIHVKLKKTVIWIKAGDTTALVQKKLQTISTANLYGLIQSGFLVGFSSIKKLGIFFDFSPGFLNLGHLLELETLKVLGNYQSQLKFPPRTKKLTLRECFLTWTFMSSIGSLSELEVLKIQNCHFQGQEKEMQPSDAGSESKLEPTSGEEEFRSLQLLLLENLNLVCWPADWTDFPKLRCLVIRRCSPLKGIPCEIGYIPTLETIDLDECSPSVVKSAKEILKEQVQYGNDDLEVRINSSKGRVSLYARDFQGDF